jgi:uncharacterized membrane-anchored protein
MNKAWWMILLFAAMVLAQWWVPVGMISGSNKILDEGTPMKFRCAPVDPNDPFRGKYIVLEFDIARYEMDTSHGFERGQEVYITFQKDSSGFDRIKEINADPERSKGPYLKATIDYINRNNSFELIDQVDSTDDEGKNLNRVEMDVISFDLPFRRFYLEESKAPMAEDIYRTGISDTTGRTYGLVYVLNGEARIKDVIIRDTSILERLRKLEK